jgi:aspartate/methionine/tyrosine aminotransferase
MMSAALPLATSQLVEDAAPAAARRTQQVEPFYVMEVMKAAEALEAQGHDLIHLSVGEPDFTAPAPVQEAAIRAIQAGRTQYTHAAGLPELRERISAWYERRFGVQVPARRIFVTSGASGALLLACKLLVNAGDEVLLPDPCYPCNKNFVAASDGVARLVPCSAELRFQLSLADVQREWTARTRGVLLASPSNPTGTSIAFDELQAIAAFVHSQGGYVIADEIYLGLSYDSGFGQCALKASSKIITINSFSKYFHMTGWRLGWIVVPDALTAPLERLAQNLFICPSTVAQHAALACFDSLSLAEYEVRRAQFRTRRDYIVPALQSLGLSVPVTPDGAFYVYVDCSRYAQSSWSFVFDVMQRAGVVLVPGKDFGAAAPERYFRLSYANSLENLHEAMARLSRYLGQRV